jgi:hypothetical protein
MKGESGVRTPPRSDPARLHRRRGGSVLREAGYSAPALESSVPARLPYYSRSDGEEAYLPP